MRLLSRTKLIFSAASVLLISTPLITHAVTAGDLLNPNMWFNSLKENITIPLPTVENGSIEIPTPQQTLEENAPRLKEINTQVKESAGVDFGKLIGWFSSFLKFIFQFITSLLENLSKALSSS